MEAATQPSSMFDYVKENERIKKLCSEWEQEIQKCTTRRDLRRYDVNVEELRNRGSLESDETLIPKRAIAAGINREKPNQLAFVEQSRRLILFKSKTNPAVSTEYLEQTFADWMRYEDWNIPWVKLIDAVDLHGGAAIEVRIDETAPLHVRLEFIPREHLIFPQETKRLQSCERLVRTFEFACFELEAAVYSYGFDADIVNKIVKDKKDREEMIKVQRVYKKEQGIVYVYWVCEHQDNFLKAPEPLMLPIVPDLLGAVQGSVLPQPTPATEYPIFWMPYEIIEDERLLMIKGRAAKDLPEQESLTKIWSATVNACTRASNVHGSIVNAPNMEPASATETVELSPNKILGREISWWSFPWPNPMILEVAQALQTDALQDKGQVDFATLNRQDRKTAREVETAAAQASLLQSLNVLSLSIIIRDVYTFCWKIAQSVIAMGLVQFPVDISLVLDDYITQPAGSVDWLQKQEMKALVKEVLPFFQNSPLALPFMVYFLELFFPEKANEFKQYLQMNQQQTQMISTLTNMLRAAPRDSLNAEENETLESTLQSADAMVGQPAGVQAPAQ